MHEPDTRRTGRTSAASFERQMLDAFGHAVVATDTDGVITYMNAAAEGLYGYEAGEAVGKPGADLLVAADAKQQGQAIRARVAAGEESTDRIRLRRKDGSTFLARLQASPVRDEDGRVAGLVGVTWDVTDEVKTRQNLFSEKEATDALIDAIPDLIFHLGRDGQYRFVHADRPDLLIRPADELLGRRVQDVMRPEAADRWMHAIERTVGNRETNRLEYTVETVTGEERTFEGHLAPLRDDGVVAIARDISARKNIERSLQTERDRFRDVIRAAPVFMAVLHGPDHVFEFVNDHYYDLVGKRDLIGRTVLDALPEVVGQGFIPLLDQVYETGVPFVGKEIPAMVSTDPELASEEHILNLNYVALRDENGNVSGILAHGVDVTDAVKARRRLEIQNEINRAILNARSTRDTARVTLEHLRESLPAAVASVLLFSEESEHVDLLADVSGEDLEGFSFGVVERRGDLNDTRFLRESDARHLKDLEDVAGSWSLAEHLLNEGLGALLMIPLQDGQNPTGVVLLAARKPFREEHIALATEAAESLAVAIRSSLLLEEIREAQTRLEALNLQLVAAHEKERHALALELHDHVGQVLTSVMFALHDVDDETMPDPVLQSLERSRSLIMELAGQVRSLSLDLRPPMLDDFGLKSTLEWYARKCESETGVEVRVSTAGITSSMLPEAVRTTAFRVIQEALTNVARHANVKDASVKVLRRDSKLFLRVRDRGTGFDVAQTLVRQTAGGLSGMVERVRLLDGELTVESAEGDGTTIIAVIPIPS